MPTGTGKTYVQAGIIANDIEQNEGFRVYVVNAPRIMLSLQLLSDMRSFLTRTKLDSLYLATHSGQVKEDKEYLRELKKAGMQYAELESTTKVTTIVGKIAVAKAYNKPIVIFSTYHSYSRVAEALRLSEVDASIVLNDEAHFMLEDRFFTLNSDLPHSRMYFFTATTRETASASGTGMNNITAYGKLIYELSPYKAIMLGKMVQPQKSWLSLDTEETIDKEFVSKNIGTIVAKGYEAHEALVNDEIEAALLVTMPGTKEIKRATTSAELKRLMEDGVEVFAVTTDMHFRSGAELKGRAEFLAQLKEVGEAGKRMIVMHYDILSEGIDVPGITGVLFLRAVKQSKFLQNLGRAARLHIEDRKRLTNGELLPGDEDKWLKPFAHAILPSFTIGDEDVCAQYEEIIDAMRLPTFKSTELVEKNDIGSAEYLEALDDLLDDLDTELEDGTDVEDVNATAEDMSNVAISYDAFLVKLSTLLQTRRDLPRAMQLVGDYVELFAPRFSLLDKGVPVTPIRIYEELNSRIDVTHEESVLVLHNLEGALVTALLQGIHVAQITLYTNCLEKAISAEQLGFNVIVEEEINFQTISSMQFDYILGNPPYQDSNGSATSKSIWHKFVASAFDACKPKGHVALVHPGQWRFDKSMFRGVKDLLTKYNTTYLNVNSVQQGVETFNVSTTYDYYVCKKEKNKGKTTVVGYDKTDVATINLEDWSVVPAGKLDALGKIMAKAGEEKVEFIHSYSAYDSRKCSKEKTAKHRYPVVYSITKRKGLTCIYTDDNTRGHFGIPKVLLSMGAAAYPILDEKGEYAFNQFNFGIADSVENLPKIMKALESPELLELAKLAGQGSNQRYERGFIANLKKDFYKDFI